MSDFAFGAPQGEAAGAGYHELVQDSVGLVATALLAGGGQFESLRHRIEASPRTFIPHIP